MAPRRAAAVTAASNLATKSAKNEASSSKSTMNASKKGDQASMPKSEKAQPNLPPKVELSPIVARLRKMWKFAAICQFLFTFDEAFGMSGFESDALEQDLDGSETRVIPDLMRRLLYTLTLDRNIDEANWQDYFRKQYIRRHPEEAVLGTIEQPVSWHSLPLSTKVETIHQACEWQLWDAEKFRKLVKNEEDAHVWRIDPVGWDGQDNTYWLFDDNRLWIQHPPPVPAQPKTASKKTSKKAKAEARRAAKRKREEASQTPTRSSTKDGQEPRSKRTRNSRGGWEEIPPELLDEEDTSAVKQDDESELSEPPPLEEEEDMVSADDKLKQDEKRDSAVNGTTVVLEDWTEFEAIAVERVEWEWIATRFAKSRHPDEKALHVLLHETILPKVMTDLAQAEKQKAHELAMANRKRSSRIALKESEREERERDRIAREKMEEKMAAIRAEEDNRVRKEREELDAVRLREDRVREREERMQAREREAIERAEREIQEREERERMRELRKLRREQGLPEDPENPPPQKSTNDEDSWELDCEVCGKKGTNLNDVQEIVCCEQCGIWQHTHCWNAFDRSVHRVQRDWEREDFYCSKCKPPAPGQPRPQRSAVKNEGNVPNHSAARQELPSQGALPSSKVASNSAVRPLAAPTPRQIENGPVRPIANQHSVQTPANHTSPGSQNTFGRPYQQRYEQGRIEHPLHQMPYAQHHFALPPNTQNSGPPSPYGVPIAGPYPSPQQYPRPPPANFPPHGMPSYENIYPQHNFPIHSQHNLPVHSQHNLPVHSQQTPIYGPPSHVYDLQRNHKSLQQDIPSQRTPAVPSSAYTHTASVERVVSPNATSNPGSVPKAAVQSNGSIKAPSPGSGVPRSPNRASLSLHSPQSTHAAAASSIPRSVASQPSGSFPLRHMSARSPLSGPHSASPTSLPTMSIGPPLQRSGSPSSGRGPPGPARPSPDQSNVNRSAQLNQELLHSRQTPSSTPSNVSNAPTPTGPGPAKGTLAKPSTSEASVDLPQPPLPQSQASLPQSTSKEASAPPPEKDHPSSTQP